MAIIRPRGEAHKPRWQSPRALGEQKKLSYAKELKEQNRQGKGREPILNEDMMLVILFIKLKNCAPSLLGAHPVPLTRIVFPSGHEYAST